MNYEKSAANALVRIRYGQPENDFMRTLRQRVDTHFLRSGLDRQDDPRMYRKTALQLGLWLGIYGLLLSNYFQGWAVFSLQVAFHFSMFLMSVGIAHDGSHHAYSRHPWLNKLTYRVFDLIGINSHMWEYNHNLSHHYVPNIPRYDSAIDSFGLFRFHPRAPYYWFHRYQHRYIFGIYALSTLFKLFFLDFYSYRRDRIGMLRLAAHPPGRIAYLLLTKAFVISYTLLLPLWVINAPAGLIVAGFLAGHFASGIALGLIFQVTHLSDHTVFPSPDRHGMIAHSFPLHILRTTTDFCTRNPLVSWIAGGLNIHVAHHLFPDISQVHLPALARIVRQTAREYAMPYREYPSVLAALRSHLRLLRQLGQKADLALTDFPVRKAYLEPAPAKQLAG